MSIMLVLRLSNESAPSAIRVNYQNTRAGSEKPGSRNEINWRRVFGRERNLWNCLVSAQKKKLASFEDTKKKKMSTLWKTTVPIETLLQKEIATEKNRRTKTNNASRAKNWHFADFVTLSSFSNPKYHSLLE